MPFLAARSWYVVPYFEAIPERVSPLCTTYTCSVSAWPLLTAITSS
nr:MAG TPA: hypothetical protein [Caudoviricetes sp.]